MLKNKILAILIMLTLSTPVFSETPVIKDVENLPENAVVSDNVETYQNANIAEDEIISDSMPKDAFKQPVSKKKIAKKFLLAMVGVAVSSILIFAVLSVYNKIRECFRVQEFSMKEPSIETPENINEAVRSFLDKTRWD